jgi:hypothetical protein
VTSSIGTVATLAARSAGIRLARRAAFVEPSDMDAEKLPAPWPSSASRSRSASPRPPTARGRSRRRDRRRSDTTISRLIGNDPQAGPRSALRRAKQLIEVGEVPAVDPAPHGGGPRDGGLLHQLRAVPALPGA